MAITKIHAIKSTLGKALAYIENPDKTDGQMLVSGYNCEPQTASIDFEMTAVLAHKARNLKRKRSTNLAYHLIQSFSPEDLYAVHLKPNCCVACFNCVRFTPSLPMCTTCPTSTISTSNP